MTRQAANAIDRRAWAVTRTRETNGAYNDDGEWVPGSPVATTIKAVVQPVKGNQLLDMPEGKRTEAGWMCWSRSELACDDKAGTFDRIVSKGITYKVVFAWPREEGGFYRAALGRMA
ncbi:hypothetical protein MNR02_06645 [Shinella sp. H4-D48]|uniref:hypothetical protein n=1 Tax=Shinella sp. H4-D48 TaxID=2925841 RepID=UPI001F53C31E|nr:hypothetical protein [Shinella sp. H4-D48]UNK39380.1 hypothetical protein MNR02_06645 [Shinella sp. H4-D48]